MPSNIIKEGELRGYRYALARPFEEAVKVIPPESNTYGYANGYIWIPMSSPLADKDGLEICAISEKIGKTCEEITYAGKDGEMYIIGFDACHSYSKERHGTEEQCIDEIHRMIDLVEAAKDYKQEETNEVTLKEIIEAIEAGLFYHDDGGEGYELAKRVRTSLLKKAGVANTAKTSELEIGDFRVAVVEKNNTESEVNLAEAIEMADVAMHKDDTDEFMRWAELRTHLVTLTDFNAEHKDYRLVPERITDE